MPATISGFWPDDIKAKVQTPLAILQARASELTDMTKGVLVGKVSSTTDSAGDQSYHSLDAVVPALKNLRQRLLTVRHKINMFYPAYISVNTLDEASGGELKEIERSPPDVVRLENKAST